MLINYAKKSFYSYRIDQEDVNRFIYVKNDVDERDLIELDNRYCKSYQDKISRRAKYLGWKFRNSVSVLLTLTINPKLYNDDKFKMWIDIKKQLNRFLTNIKYHFKKQGRKFPPYICSIEAQKNGNPHLHICFLGAGRLLDWRKIRDIWKLGHIFINRDNSGRKIRNPVNYLMKYITKAYTTTNEKNELTQALCWLFNIRSYQCSRGLITPLKSGKKDSGWYSEYLVVVDDSIPLIDIYLNLDLIENYNFIRFPFKKNGGFFGKDKCSMVV